VLFSTFFSGVRIAFFFSLDEILVLIFGIIQNFILVTLLPVFISSKVNFKSVFSLISFCAVFKINLLKSPYCLNLCFSIQNNSLSSSMVFNHHQDFSNCFKSSYNLIEKPLFKLAIFSK